MSPRLSSLIARPGRWALRGLLAVALGATLASSGITAAGAGTLAHQAGTPASHPVTSLAPRGVATPHIRAGLLYHGGPVQNAPRVYVVFWGWANDPNHEQGYLINFLMGVANSNWLCTVRQYGGGCGNVFVNAWSDPAAIPLRPTDAQIQAEAAKADAHFAAGNSVNVQIVVATPTGHFTTGFGTQWCAYHGAVAAVPNITYTNLPYMTDAGANCGEGSVNHPGILDGVSIVEGHELAEAITDPLLNAWFDAQGQEIGDKCAWFHLHNIVTPKGVFAVQPLWSNAAGACVG